MATGNGKSTAGQYALGIVRVFVIGIVNNPLELKLAQRIQHRAGRRRIVRTLQYDFLFGFFGDGVGKNHLFNGLAIFEHHLRHRLPISGDTGFFHLGFADVHLVGFLGLRLERNRLVVNNHARLNVIHMYGVIVVQRFGTRRRNDIILIDSYVILFQKIPHRRRIGDLGLTIFAIIKSNGLFRLDL